MGKIYKLTFLSLLLVIAFSCSDEDSLPKPEVSFSTEKAVNEINVPVTFVNSTTNASSYAWDFGDGQTSEDFSPTIIYEDPGTYTVTLVATTDDNQSEEATLQVEVGERLLFDVVIQTLSFVNNDGLDWDEINPDSASFKFPDFWFVLGPNDDPNFDLTISSGGLIIPDLSPNQLAVGFSLNEGLPLTDEPWTVLFFDFDGADIEDIQQDDPSELMSFIEFNPIQDADPDENGEGVIEVQQGSYSVEIGFRIE